MKKYLHIALMLLCVLVIPACGDDNKVDQEAVELEAYKLEQEVAFLEKADDPNYVKWESEAGDGYVFAKLKSDQSPSTAGVYQPCSIACVTRFGDA